MKYSQIISCRGTDMKENYGYGTDVSCGTDREACCGNDIFSGVAYFTNNDRIRVV